MSGFCIRIGRRSRTFLLATSAGGQQVRVTLGRWPLLSVSDARALAAPMLLDCRKGISPRKPLAATKLPVLAEAIASYCQAKRLKQSSANRYQSFVRTHFGQWMSQPIDKLHASAFREHCLRFSQSAGPALVDLGRGLFGSLFNYLNVTHGTKLVSPFRDFAAAGLMPSRSKPRARQLAEADLHQWRCAVERLPDAQRDYLLLIAYTGLRRNECAFLRSENIDFEGRTFCVSETKNGKSHVLPLTARTEAILRRRLEQTQGDVGLFEPVAPDHVAKMAIRHGAPKFMLHDLRKMVATVAEQLGLSDTIKRRLLNHAAPRGDTLNRHYVCLEAKDIREPLETLQNHLDELMSAPMD
jgi:integrase